jgi:outer membrane protein OmpU
MDKLKKVGLTALGTALVSSASVAGDMAVTGSAIMTFVGNNNENTNNGWSMSDTMSFSGSGDLDNGWSVTFSHAIDNGSNDANSIAIDMGDMGSLTFAGKGGSGPVAANDDKMPSANEESWANSAGTKTSAATGASGNSGFNYTLPELMENVSMEVYYLPSAAGSTSSFEYGLTYTGIDGLTVGYAGGENETTATNAIDSTNLWATYVYDSFTIGAQRNETDQTTADADSDFNAYGVSYAVNDELSVSYGISTVEHENSSKEDQDAAAVSFSYVTGGMTISGSMADVDNVGGTASVDNSGYELNVTFAF